MPAYQAIMRADTEARNLQKKRQEEILRRKRRQEKERLNKLWMTFNSMTRGER